MKYYLIAGEASGDLHASNLMLAMAKLDAAAQFRVWGGDKMETAGGKIIKHYRELAFMGFAEVAMNIRTILGNIRFCKEDIQNWQPDALILIDYPGFNMRIAKWAKAKGIRVYYYISPQIWAWNTKRVHQLGRNVDRVLVILPFEKQFYADHGYDVDFVGHPLLDVTENFQSPMAFPEDQNIIALLPGSRRQEISTILQEMLSVVSSFPQYHFYIAGAPAIEAAFYQKIIAAANLEKAPTLVFGQTYELLTQTKVALVASGTATLETALFKVPQVVCYRGNWINYRIFKSLIKVKYISLVNLIMDKKIVEELLQADLNKENLIREINHLLKADKRKQLKQEYALLREMLGNQGASERTAKLIWSYLQNQEMT